MISSSLMVPTESDSELLGYQIAAVVRNDGDAWARLEPFETDWAVLNAQGGVTSTGSMSSAYPQYVGPGGTAYLLAYDVVNDVDPQELVSVEIALAVSEASEADVTFEIENTQVRTDQFYGMTATGFVTSTEDRDFVEVGLICLDGNGEVIGFANAQLQDVVAGERKAFETTGPPNQVSADDCADTVIEATPHDF